MLFTQKVEIISLHLRELRFLKKYWKKSVFIHYLVGPNIIATNVIIWPVACLINI